MIHHQQEKQQEAAAQTAAQQQTYQNQADMQAMQEQISALQTQQVQAAVPPPSPSPQPVAAAAPAPVAPSADLITQLQQLSELKSAGALTDAEFTAAKAKLLGTG
jgi:hypothetical protein